MTANSDKARQNASLRVLIQTSLSARFGALVKGGFAACPLYLLRYRAELMLTSAELIVVLGLLAHHRRADEWCSFGQEMLARTLCVKRPTLNQHLMNLRRRGHLAVRPDLVHRPAPGLSAPLHYNLDPLLAALGKVAANAEGRGDAELAAILDVEAEARLASFIRDVTATRWHWMTGTLDSAKGASVVDVARAYARRFAISFEVTR